MVSFPLLVQVWQAWHSRIYVSMLAMIPIMTNLEFLQYQLILSALVLHVIITIIISIIMRQEWDRMQDKTGQNRAYDYCSYY